ncbi:MAG: ATP-binding protein [Bacteroidetes bacterium]|nr:ATP-binding protein [Bacteroidota bacterium]
MQKGKIHPIKQLISQGEHVHLDFKFEISDAPKIARSLSAFANTEGGKLLVGVKDNGTIAGISSEEEHFMIDQAAKLYCHPEVEFKSKEWVIAGKKVLEITVPKSEFPPHRAPDMQGNYKAYYRLADQNVLAHGIQIKVWKKLTDETAVVIVYNEVVKTVLSVIEQQTRVNFETLRTMINLSKHNLEELLSDLVVMQVISMKITENQLLFYLASDETK